MRRAVHGLLSAALLAGMSLALAGALAAVMSEMSDVSSREARCQVWRAEIHKISGSAAYAAVSAANLGSAPWASASASFEGDGGEPARLTGGGPVPAGGSWRAAGTVEVPVSPGEEYLVLVSATAEDGSEPLCARLARAR